MGMGLPAPIASTVAHVKHIHSITLMRRHRAAGNGLVSLKCCTNPCMLVTAGACSGRETQPSELHQREALYITHHIGLRRASGQYGDLYSMKYGEIVWKSGMRSASESKAWKECPPRGARGGQK